MIIKLIFIDRHGVNNASAHAELFAESHCPMIRVQDDHNIYTKALENINAQKNETVEEKVPYYCSVW